MNSRSISPVSGLVRDASLNCNAEKMRPPGVSGQPQIHRYSDTPVVRDGAVRSPVKAGVAELPLTL